MFVQVIEGRVGDAAGLRRQWQDWMENLSPGAVGWLGSTAGITPEDRFIAAVRFESAAAAGENANRAEQSRWWTETEPTLEGVTFHESSDYNQVGECSDDARFVQMMRGRATDRRRLEEIDEQMNEVLPRHRPDVLGSYQIWLPDDAFVAVTYFSSEEEARAGESQALPDNLAGLFDEWLSLMDDLRWFDLPDPWLDSSA